MLGVKRPVRKADKLPPSCAVATKSGNLNFLEPSGPFQASNGTATAVLVSLTSCDIKAPHKTNSTCKFALRQSFMLNNQYLGTASLKFTYLPFTDYLLITCKCSFRKIVLKVEEKSSRFTMAKFIEGKRPSGCM